MKFIITTDTHYGFDAPGNRKAHERFVDAMAEAIADNQCAAIIHTGDWISHRQAQLEKTFKLFRSKISVPIFTVFGNHDYWHAGKGKGRFRFFKSPDMDAYRLEVLSKYDITHVGNTPTVFNDILFMGMDGWYHHAKPPTNDASHLCKLILDGYVVDKELVHPVLARKAHQDLDKILSTVGNYTASKKVFLTHFPPFAKTALDHFYSGNPAYIDFIKDCFDVLCYGHTHEAVDVVENGLRIINDGAEYNKPNFKIIEL